MNEEWKNGCWVCKGLKRLCKRHAPQAESKWQFMYELKPTRQLTNLEANT